MVKQIKSILKNTVHKPENGLAYWQEKIFLNILLVLLFVGVLAYALAMTIAIKQSAWSVVLIDTVALGLIMILFFGRFIPVVYRINTLVFMALLMGFSYLFIIGAEGPGLLYLVGFNILTSLLLGLRKAYYSLATTVAVIGLIAAGMHFGFADNSMIMQYSTLSFLASSVNVLLISSICSIPLAILVQTLEKNIRYQNALRKRLQFNVVALKEAKERAEESDRLKSSFLANMSHEIRTPLNAILGFSQIIKEQPDLSIEERTGFINTINDSGEYLLKIIEDVLDISMIEANQLKYSLCEVDVSLLFKELSLLYDPRIKETHEVIVLFPDDLSQLTLLTDEQRLKQILVNLINNALKNTRKGFVKVGYEVQKNTVEFYVKDTGRGIRKEDQEQIFKRFVKIQGGGFENAGGTGLGLSITQGILKMLGGKIHLESQPDVGTTFYFSIPINKTA